MSRGSVIPKFLENIKLNKTLNLTHPDMTRFNISLDEGVNFVIYSLINSIGGEIFVPKLPSFKIIDLIKCLSPKSKYKITGIRSGEKLHEEMITTSDSYNTIESKKFYIILPQGNIPLNKYMKKFKANKNKIPFSYNSSENSHFLKQNELKKIIQQEIQNN